MVSKSEGQQLAANGATTDADDQGWGAWDDGEQDADEPVKQDDTKQTPAEGDDDGTDAWGWGEDEGDKDEKLEETEQKNPDDEEDPTEAWGWGEETNVEAVQVDEKLQPAKPAPRSQPKEVVFKETYSITSMPQPVLDLIQAVAKDGAALTQDVYATSPVAAAAAGLFSLPTLALAMFRAVSPYYYAPDTGGNM